MSRWLWSLYIKRHTIKQFIIQKMNMILFDLWWSVRPRQMTHQSEAPQLRCWICQKKKIFMSRKSSHVPRIWCKFENNESRLLIIERRVGRKRIETYLYWCQNFAILIWYKYYVLYVLCRRDAPEQITVWNFYIKV